MNKIDFSRIASAIDGFRVVPQWLPDGYRRGNEWVARNPQRVDRAPGSFSVNMATGAWADFAMGDEAEGGDLVSLFAYLFHGNDNGKAARELASTFGLDVGPAPAAANPAPSSKPAPLEQPEPILPVPATAPAPDFRHPTHGEPSAVYTYRDKQGRILLHVCRFDPPNDRKQICPLAWCTVPGKADAWRWRGITGAKPRPLYGLDRLAAMPDAEVLIVEGEKSADAAQRLVGDAFAVVAWLGGTATADKVQVGALRGRTVYLWPDFDRQADKAGDLLPFVDQPGPKAMITIAQRLAGSASQVFLVGYDPASDRFASGWDLADAEADGWKAGNVQAFLASHAADWQVTAGRNGAPAEESEPDRSRIGDDPETPAADNDNAPAQHLPLDARLNSFAFPYTSDKGVILSCVENLDHLMREYGIRARYNVIAKDVEIDIPGAGFTVDNRAGNSLSLLVSLCARNRVPVGNVAEFVTVIADRDIKNPAAEWIESRPWDGVDRLPDLVKTLDPEDPTLAAILLRRWLIGAVACAMSPSGFAMQGVLVLQGQQNAGKTTWFRNLFADDLALFKEGVQVNPADRDSVKGALSHFAVELGELDATFRKADVAALKAFITRDRDELRLPYMRTASVFPRRTVFCATVNERAYLRDETGNRRYWSIVVGANLNPRHKVDVQQVFAQMLVAWRAGEQHRLLPIEMDALNGANEAHTEISPIEELVLSRFDWSTASRPYGLTSTEVLLIIGYKQPNRAQVRECGAVLRKLTGADPRKSNGRKVYAMPPKNAETYI